MSLLEIILLGIALAMDCFSVSLAKGISARKLLVSPALLMALLFGLFQAGMPLIGFFAGTYFASIIERIAPWLALILLSFIGGKMIWEYFHEDQVENEDQKEDSNPYGLMTLLVLSVATSIDALATGLLFVPQPKIIWLAVGIIGICSTLFSLLGTTLGVYLGRRFHFPAELIGGLILIAIGLKIFLGY